MIKPAVCLPAKEVNRARAHQMNENKPQRSEARKFFSLPLCAFAPLRLIIFEGGMYG
jgi:hypothetical protein